MRYWILTTEYPPERSGGIGTYMKEHSEVFASYGHQISIFYGKEKNSDQTIHVASNIVIHAFSVHNRSSSKFLGFEASLSYEFSERIIQQLTRETPDIIEVQEYLGIGYYLLLRKLLGEPLLQNIPILVTAHAPSFLYLEYNHFPVYRFPEYWVGEMERFSLLAADLVISPSQYLIDTLRSRMAEKFPQKVFQIFNPYGPKKSPLSGAKTIERNKLVVFGKMSISKGALQLLQEADRLWKAGIEFSIEWIGGSDIYLHTEEKTIGQFVREQYQEHIAAGRLHLTGNMAPEDAIAKLATAHCIVIPSLIDNLPYTVIEAMAAGKVVLASDAGGQSELLSDGENGFLFSWDRAGQFEKQLLHILSLSEDELLQIGSTAAESIEVCSPAAYYDKKYRIISELLADTNFKQEFPILRPQERPAKIYHKEFQQGLSVVIPYYNMGQYIEDCLASIYSTSYPPAKVILINDGSTEQSSIEKLFTLEKKYPFLEIIHQPNAGLSATRNIGLKKISTQYVVFLDADDTIAPGYFEKAIRILERYKNLSFVTCWIRYFGAAKGIWPGHNPELPYLLYHNTVHSGSVFNTRDLLNIEGYDEELLYGMEDYEIAINLVSKGFHGVCLPETLFNYRIRKKSMSKSFTNNKQLYLYRLLTVKHASLFRKYGGELTNLLNANGPGYLHDNPTMSSRHSARSIQSANYWKEKARKTVRRFPFLRKPVLAIAHLIRK